MWNNAIKNLLIMFSENGINNISSPQFKDNNFIISTSHDNNTFINNNNNLNSYAKSTTNSTNPSNDSPSNIPTSPTTPSSSSSSSPSSSFAHQLRILIPNYDDLMDTIRSQQPHSSNNRGAGGSGSGMQNDRRNMNMMNDRRMMDRQMVS